MRLSLRDAQMSIFLRQSLIVIDLVVRDAEFFKK